MKNQCCISIITPAYNAEKYIPRVNACLEKQTYSNFEWIVINDSSKDNTDEIMKNILSNTKLNIKYIRNEKNLGVSLTRNKGLDIAEGKYICFLDADDSWEPEKLETQLNFMQQNNIPLSYMDYYQVDTEGKIIKTIIADNECDYNKLLYANILGNLTCMVEKQLVGQTRFIKHGHEDYIFWLHILSQIPKAVKVKSNKILCNYTVSSNSLSGNKFKAAIWKWKIYRNILKLSFIDSIYYFSFYSIQGLKKHFF